MSKRLVNVKHYKRGAKWSDGATRLCTRCGTENKRKNQAVVVADIADGRFRIPVGYCEPHIPEGLEVT